MGCILGGTYPVTLFALLVRAVEVVLVVSFPLQTIPLASAVALSHSCPVVVAQCSNEATQKVRMIDGEGAGGLGSLYEYRILFASS